MPLILWMDIGNCPNSLNSLTNQLNINRILTLSVISLLYTSFREILIVFIREAGAHSVSTVPDNNRDILNSRLACETFNETTTKSIQILINKTLFLSA